MISEVVAVELSFARSSATCLQALHLAGSGHPILGDDLYATGTAREDDRLMLHAAELTVPHPDDGRPVRFAANSPLPAP